MEALHIKVLLVASLITIVTTESQPKKCLANFNSRMDHCTHVTNKNHIAWETELLCQSLNINRGKSICLRKSSCAKELRLTIFDQQLFALTMKNTFIGMLSRCCQKCAACSVVNVVKDNTMVTESILNSSDIVFPVLAKDPAIEMHGFYFLAAYDAPSAYYFSPEKSEDTILKEIITAYVNLWPFLLICLLFAFISGFVIWLIEAPTNKEHFSTPFCPGMFDGFWWSFIAMTTVGFGDKVTKSYAGKLFAIFWVLLGITMFSMLTATVTTEIINARSPANTDMAGKDIAVLKGRIHDMSVVANHGGVLHMGSIGHTMRGIDELITMVENQTVHGYLIDKNTFRYFNSRLKEEKYQYIAQKIERVGITMTEKSHNENNLKCGILVRHMKDFRYFSGYFDNNRLAMHSCNAIRMNTRNNRGENGKDFFAPGTRLFDTVITYSMAIVGAAVVFGVSNEVRRYFFKKKRTVFPESTS